MKILIINYEMDRNSGVLAWQAEIAAAIARQCEQVTVLTQHIGEYDFTANMHVIKLKMFARGKLNKFGGAWFSNLQLLRIVMKQKPDVCFVHMAAEWAWYFFPVLKLFAIPTIVWYAHGTVTKRLQRVLWAARRIVTPNAPSFRISSPKVHVIGHGVNTDIFNIPSPRELGRDLIYVGRLSPRKRIDILLAVLQEINKRSPDAPFRLRLIGPLLTQKDLCYDAAMRVKAWELGIATFVDFVGFVPQHHIPKFYRTAFLHLSMSETGSIDKAVLEALACGCPVLTNNEGFKNFFNENKSFFIESCDPVAIALRVLELYQQRATYDPESLRRLVVGQHDQASYVTKLFQQFKEVL